MGLLDLMPDWLSQSATIQRGNPATAPSGQSNKYYAAVAEAVPCQIQIQRGQFFRADFGDNAAAIALAFFQADVDVRVGDRVLEGSSVWLVDAVNAPRDTEADHLEVTVHLITGGTP